LEFFFTTFFYNIFFLHKDILIKKRMNLHFIRLLSPVLKKNEQYIK